MPKITSKKALIKTLITIYKTIMILLSLVIMLLSIWDLIFKFDEKTIIFINKFDVLVMGIFIMDLLINLILAKDKKHFLKVSIIEILIITPFTVFLKVPSFLERTTGIQIYKGDTVLYIENYPRLKGFINTLLSQKFILRSFTFIMKPSVTRAAKFFNLSRSYFNKTKKKKD